MKKKVHLIDMRFNPAGHFMGDLKEFESLNESFEFSYTAIGKILEKETSINIKNITGIKWLDLFFILLFNRGGNVIFLSCSYLPLLFFSALTLNFNYYFRFTSMPYKMVGVYSKVIRLLSKYTKGIIVCDYPVKDFLISELDVNSDNISVLIGRAMDENHYVKKYSEEKTPIKVSFVGALNNEKDLSIFIDVISNVRFDHIEFTLVSKGLNQYESELKSIFNSGNSVTLHDSFLSDAEYKSIISRTDYLVIPYTKNYGVRASAVLFDAMKLGKKAITISLPQFEYYKSNFNICLTYSDKKTLIQTLQELSINQKVAYDKLFERYSRCVFVEQFRGLKI